MIAYYRGFTVSEFDSKGAMLAVGSDHQAAEQLISSLDIQDNVCIACINSPKSTTISDNVSTVEQLFSICKIKECLPADWRLMTKLIIRQL